MKIVQSGLALLLAAAVVVAQGTQTPFTPQEPARPTEEQIKSWPIERRAQHYAGNFLDELPNFIVTENIQRMERAPGRSDWQTQDKLEVELTYSQKKGDSYKLLKQNGKPAAKGYEKVDGATSTGEFGGIIATLFRGQFSQPRQEKLRERRTLAFNFAVTKQDANYLLTEKKSGRQVKTGLEGTVWIDAETARILRIEYSATQIPPEFPLSMAEHAVEYDEVKVNNKKYFLPVSSEFIVGSDATRLYSRNLVEFRNYQIFETEVKVLPEEDSPKKKP